MNIPANRNDVAATHSLVLLAKKKYESTSLEAEVLAFGIYREVGVLLRHGIQPENSPLNWWAFAARAYGEKLSRSSLDTCFAIADEVGPIQRAELRIICDKYFGTLPSLEHDRFFTGVRSWYSDSGLSHKPPPAVNADQIRILGMFRTAMWATIWRAMRLHRS